MAAETEVASSTGHDLNTMWLQGDPITAEEADKHNGMLPSVIYRCRGRRGGGCPGWHWEAVTCQWGEVNWLRPRRKNSHVANRRCARQMNAHTHTFSACGSSLCPTTSQLKAHLFAELWTHDGLMPHSLRAQEIPLLSTRMPLFGQIFTLYKSTHDSWRAAACEGVLKKNIWPPRGLTICP